MKAVLQKVAQASVTVDNEIVGSINRGLCVFLGIAKGDQEKDLDYMVKKILNIRVFENPEEDPEKDPKSRGIWQKSVKALDLEILCVSQFTLQAKTDKGYKPDFHRAMETDDAKEMYTRFLEKLGKEYRPEKIQDGRFGAMMLVNIVNDGPVTLELDSRKYDSKKNEATPTVAQQ